jgi:hypothetical protein
MNPIEESIYQYINNIIEISEEQEPLLIQYCRMFSAVITGSFYVLDISKNVSSISNRMIYYYVVIL